MALNAANPTALRHLCSNKADPAPVPQAEAKRIAAAQQNNNDNKDNNDSKDANVFRLPASYTPSAQPEQLGVAFVRLPTVLVQRVLAGFLSLTDLLRCMRVGKAWYHLFSQVRASRACVCVCVQVCLYVRASVVVPCAVCFALLVALSF